MAAMTNNSKRTGPALEAHYQLLTWLMPTVEKFPRSHKFIACRSRIRFRILRLLMTRTDKIESGPGHLHREGRGRNHARGRQDFVEPGEGLTNLGWHLSC